MNSRCFERLLRELDFEAAAANSVLNHHVHGMDYLCLHRSDRLTVKLYFIDPLRVPRGSGAYLVTPHTHRYAFESTVLAGHLQHITFSEIPGAAYDRFAYAPEQRERMYAGESDLEVSSKDIHDVGGEYWCGITDIHTLVVPKNPVLLGLVQFGDAVGSSTVYLRKGDQMLYPTSRRPAVIEALGLRDKALEMMEAA